MDRTVPLAAARLLDFIRETEVGTDGPSGYNVIFGFNQDKLPKPITQMTVDELIGAQSSFTRRFGSSASGGYQFMRATLKDLKRELGLRGSQVMDADLQDRLGFHLLKRRGYEAFMAGRLDRTEFGKRLAMEWASFPVLADTQGAHRAVKRGQSYYVGDALNRALVRPDEIERVIEEARQLGDAMPATAPIPTPRPEPEKEPPMPKGDLSPIEETNKANKGGLSGLGGGTMGGALIYLWSLTSAFPAEWASDPQAIVALTTVAATVTGAITAWIGAYRAIDKRFQSAE